MSKTTLKSKLIINNYRLFRVKATEETAQQIKDILMERMNLFLEDRDGKLINVKVLPNFEVCCFFVSGNEEQQKAGQTWEQEIKTQVLYDMQLNPSIMELSPSINL